MTDTTMPEIGAADLATALADALAQLNVAHPAMSCQEIAAKQIDTLLMRQVTTPGGKYLVSLGNTTAEAPYLIEFRYFPGEATEMRRMCAGELIKFLTGNIEHEHYADDCAEVVGLWRYDGGGKLGALTLAHVRTTPDDNDCIHSRYEVHESARPDKAPELRFTVTIDGRV